MYFIGYWDKVQCISLVAETKFNVFHWLLDKVQCISLVAGTKFNVLLLHYFTGHIPRHETII